MNVRAATADGGGAASSSGRRSLSRDSSVGRSVGRPGSRDGRIKAGSVRVLFLFDTGPAADTSDGQPSPRRGWGRENTVERGMDVELDEGLRRSLAWPRESPCAVTGAQLGSLGGCSLALLDLAHLGPCSLKRPVVGRGPCGSSDLTSRCGGPAKAQRAGGGSQLKPLA